MTEKQSPGPTVHWGQSAPPRPTWLEVSWGGKVVVPLEGQLGPPKNTSVICGRECQEGGERGNRSGSLGPGIRRALLPGGCNTRWWWTRHRDGRDPRAPFPTVLPSHLGASSGTPPWWKCTQGAAHLLP